MSTFRLFSRQRTRQTFLVLHAVDERVVVLVRFDPRIAVYTFADALPDVDAWHVEVGAAVHGVRVFVLFGADRGHHLHGEIAGFLDGLRELEVDVEDYVAEENDDAGGAFHQATLNLVAWEIDSVVLY